MFENGWFILYFITSLLLSIYGLIDYSKEDNGTGQTKMGYIFLFFFVLLLAPLALLYMIINRAKN